MSSPLSYERIAYELLNSSAGYWFAKGSENYGKMARPMAKVYLKLARLALQGEAKKTPEESAKHKELVAQITLIKNHGLRLFVCLHTRLGIAELFKIIFKGPLDQLEVFSDLGDQPCFVAKRYFPMVPQTDKIVIKINNLSCVLYSYNTNCREWYTYEKERPDDGMVKPTLFIAPRQPINARLFQQVCHIVNIASQESLKQIVQIKNQLSAVGFTHDVEGVILSYFPTFYVHTLTVPNLQLPQINYSKS